MITAVQKVLAPECWRVIGVSDIRSLCNYGNNPSPEGSNYYRIGIIVPKTHMYCQLMPNTKVERVHGSAGTLDWCLHETSCVYGYNILVQTLEGKVNKSDVGDECPPPDSSVLPPC